MFDLSEAKKQNQKTAQEWVTTHKEKYREKFEKYFDYDAAKVDKFLSNMEGIVRNSEDRTPLPQNFGEHKNGNFPIYKQILNEDYSVNITKFNAFLDNIEKALSWTTFNRDQAWNNDHKQQNFDFSNFNGHKYFREAFPEEPSRYGIEFILKNFVGNENCKGIINIILPDIKEVFKNNPEAEKEFLQKIMQYENAALKGTESTSLSNDIDKLFKGSSELGKGSSNKAMTE